MNLEYNNVDLILSNGFDVNLYFKNENDKVAYAKITRTPGHTEAEAYWKYHKIEIEMKSDYITKLFMSFQHKYNDKKKHEFSLNIDKIGQNDYDASIKILKPGLSETYKGTIRHTYPITTIEIFVNDQKVSKFVLKWDFGEFQRGAKLPIPTFYKFDLKWEATDSLWAQVTSSYEIGIHEFTLKACS